MNNPLMSWRDAVRVAFAVTLVFSLGGCASTISIGELLAEPGRYDGETVQVEGTVTRSAGVLGVGGYEVDDGTGQIFVVARGTGVPAEGLRTKVKGTFEPIFSFGGRSVAAIVQNAQASPER
jgi:hypothetical protein